MVKIGQVYYNEKIGQTLVITYIDELDCSWITSEGRVCTDRKVWINKSCTLLAEYPTWEEAMVSDEFKSNE